jgi:16S rRNA (adenine1518-N6/adenine1519-N6)-dimethyltransferase
MGRRLGQHFLRSHAARRLVELIAPRPDDVFLEIGPGGGALTLPLAARCREIVAVELDPDLVVRLQGRAPNVRVVHADALDVDLAGLVPHGARVAGNLPYAISSPLLRRFLEMRGHVRDLHLMLQEEVADRIAAPPGGKDYGILSVLYAVSCETDIPLRFGPEEFEPKPKVRSAILRARFLPSPRVAIDNPAGFERLVQKAFSQRRKTLENNLKDSYPNLKEHLRLLNIEGQRRAETLSVGDFAELARRLVVD